MANTSRPMGLRFVGSLTAGPVTGMVNQYLVPSADGTAIYVGDAVKSNTTSGGAAVFVNGQDCEGMPSVIRAAAGDTLRGVVVGFLPKQSDLTVLHREASTNRIALVVDDPNAIFEMEANGVGVAQTDVGNNADLVATAGSATTGQSAMVLDSSTVGTATATLRILGLVKRPDNALGTSDKVLVRINEHEFLSTTGT
jgi:hypothetical protein